MKMNYLLKGKGETIVLLHGWGGSLQSLKPLQDILSQKYQVLNIDLPGFGKSLEPTQVIGIEYFANSVVELTTKLGINKFNLFGHSFGGQIAAQIALKFPDKVQNLILCNAAIIRRKSLKTKVIINSGKLLKLFRLSGLFNPISRNLDYTKASPMMKLIMNKILTEDLTGEIHKIKLPTLILWGEKDKITPVEQAYIIHKNMPSSQIVIDKESKHGLPLTNPDFVAKNIEMIQNGL